MNQLFHDCDFNNIDNLLNKKINNNSRHSCLICYTLLSSALDQEGQAVTLLLLSIFVFFSFLLFNYYYVCLFNYTFDYLLLISLL